MRKLLCLFLVFLFTPQICAFAAANSPARPLVIIDPGHGGADGGAVGLAGAAEKHFNLSTALKLADLMTLSGYEVLLTRTTDDDTDGTPEFNKRQDILAREALGRTYPQAPFISIHMNSSASPNDKGFQVFYGTQNAASKDLCAQVYTQAEKSNLTTRLREQKAAPNTVYLMQNLPNPCVLAECGFIRNAQDFNLLSSPVYRLKLAMVLLAAVNGYFNG